MTALERRVVRLEDAVAGPAPSPSYVVWVPSEAIGDAEAVQAAISEHQRRTGYQGAVMVLPPLMTTAQFRQGARGAAGAIRQAEAERKARGPLLARLRAAWRGE
jgi:hypothetical protein